MESEVQKITGVQIKKGKRLLIVAMIIICSLLAFYLSASIYFVKHFYFGSEINSINVSGKTVEEAEGVVMDMLQKYTLYLEGRQGQKESINGKDIGLKHNSKEDIQKIKDKQNPLGWILGVFSAKNSFIEVTFDEKLLQEQIDKLSYFDEKNIVEPINAKVEFKDNGYVIIEEVKGTKIKKDVILSKIKEAILKGKSSIDLDKEGCYEEPKYTTNSKEILELKKILDKYVATKITYTFGESKEVLDGAIINKWLTVDDNLQISIDENQVRVYVDSLAMKYNTVAKKRDFVTSSGKNITVSGGNYGWSINKPKEVQDIIASVKEGQNITREASFYQRANAYGSNDIGNTYLEVDLSKQHIWYYKEGKLIADGDVVTGNISKNYGTPTGVYTLAYKQRNAVLRGEDYATPVSYWMPFNGNIGLHDASWRDAFGGEIYKTKGSHGCVNAPPALAKTIYESIEAGTPVICYN
ncbi:MAG: L,D-transpeptidase family protein [Clostridiales bacterium]|uniref:L,D-transpeptidase family protein n=1 Tax=Clostridium sp. N3C TaxID=1776758 RepID=UPI00092E09B1|nr:peptidoglycan binding domain-containing protein [Clostridium sp. N3C]NLZ49447.1 L,D-transpeptidase family protein [Clostridiales bacterium]SCN24928.1 putative vancomycin resistance protein [Clostridium sp. N3C]